MGSVPVDLQITYNESEGVISIQDIGPPIGNA